MAIYSASSFFQQFRKRPPALRTVRPPCYLYEEETTRFESVSNPFTKTGAVSNNISSNMAGFLLSLKMSSIFCRIRAGN
ncbi:predicted protein [Methanosarcina acetivorans C2A]|uniref:Uncharacterized protein n=1 Tax=Methanosarcina acetivorans (strain ATCC 35395 / DSM 2834 / JCM 12185 / C2A) TaxID=188937 RepID=Q8TNT8_METAC|nr:predicted protein [Methanosarcina acetivorans C2A]